MFLVWECLSAQQEDRQRCHDRVAKRLNSWARGGLCREGSQGQSFLFLFFLIWNLARAGIGNKEESQMIFFEGKCAKF
jgi:hypothetical protein